MPRKRQNQYVKKLQELGWVDAHGTPRYPKDDAALVRMLRDMLGAELVSHFDNIVGSHQDMILGLTSRSGAKKHGTENPEERYIRKNLGKLTPKERDAVCCLIYRTAELVLFSVCTQLDQFKGGSVTISIDPSTEGGPRRPIVIHPRENELHHELPGWVEAFSQITQEVETE